MQWEDLKNKSQTELKELLAENKSELHSLSFQAHHRELKQVHKIKLAKRTIARISALLQNKKSAEQAGK